MKKFTKKIVFPILGLSILLLSCGESKKEIVDEKVNTEEENVIKTSSVPESKFESAGFIDKYNKYIDFSNSFNSRVYDSYDRYFGWADIDKGPKGAKHARGLYTLNEHALQNLKNALDSEEVLEGVDGPMKVVYEKAMVLYNVSEEADGYYEKEDYKDDDFAKGEILHGKLISAFDEYFAAYSAMKLEFVILQNELFEYDAAKFKEDNSLIQYNLMMSLHNAKGVFVVIGDLDGPALKDLDLEKYKEQVAKFRANFDALEKLISDESQITKEYGDSSSMDESSFSSFIRYGNDFITQSRNLKERVENNKFKYSITHPSIPDSGSPLKVNDVYSDMVDQYNRLN